MSSKGDRYRVGDDVRIQWADAAAKAGWQHDDKEFGLIDIVSTGYVVEKTAEYITLVSDVSETGSSARHQSIPKGCIKHVVVMERGAIKGGAYHIK